MKVKVMQRIPDKDTLERHDHTYEAVKQVKVYKAIIGGMFLHLIFADGRGLHLNLENFDFETEE
jgi:hypothetical protein